MNTEQAQSTANTIFLNWINPLSAVELNVIHLFKFRELPGIVQLFWRLYHMLYRYINHLFVLRNNDLM